VEVDMALEKKYIRDGRNKIIGSVTDGYAQDTSIVRDADGHVLGRTSGLFNTTRRTDGSIVSINSADPGLLIPKK
jgi:hypothetical protein